MAEPDGTFTLTNSRTGEQKTYSQRNQGFADSRA